MTKQSCPPPSEAPAAVFPLPPGAARSVLFAAAVLLLLVAIGVASRWWWIGLPNFKPVAALALFAGFYFRSWRWGVACPLLVLLVSNLWLGVYDWPIFLAVSASLAIAGVLGSWFARHFPRRPASWREWSRQAGGWLGLSLITATLFFVLTNFAVWCCWYPSNWEGLADCYFAAIPFFRWTLAGNVVFTFATMGTFHVLQTLFVAEEKTLPAQANTEWLTGRMPR